ncbi:MAG: hypothetical protein VYA84_07590 [Planctomycetota bacterium]|nr:hypothetical protein [Planctomycetota bacterium]
MTRSLILLSVAFFLASDAIAQVKLPTLDEALARSSQTGQPIFAMAGQKT